MKSGSPLRLGAILFDGFELLDLYGPLEFFGLLPDRLEVITVGERAGTIPSSQRPSGWAEISLYDEGTYDILLVPGGLGTRRLVNDPPFLQALAEKAKAARYVASVCTGSALLARAGLLDGRRATSNKRAFAWVKGQGTRVQWIPEARWVEDGPYFTSSGVAAGMDMSLGLIERIFERKTALEVAQWAEYEWHDDATQDPFAKLNGLTKG